MGSLDGKTAIVTGGASGIGLASAKLLAHNGARVLVTDINEQLGREAASQVDGEFVCADAGSSRDWDLVCARLDSMSNRLDIAHLNTGIPTGEADVTSLTDEQFDRALRTNVHSAFYGLRALVPRLARDGGGAVAITASLAGLIGYDVDPVYCLSKHALVGYVRALAPQLSAKGVTINAICPNVTATPAIGPVELWEQAGVEVMSADQIADAVLRAVLGSETGQAIVCQPGRDPVSFRFRNVPGPRPTRET